MTIARAKRTASDGERRGPSLAKRVYDLLRAEILSCALEPGRELSEAGLAERFQVSKTPVREALARLTAEGLMRIFPRRGYQVAPLTFGDMSDLFQVRAILEAGTAELACRRIAAPEIDRLAELAEAAYERSEHPSVARFVRANRDFHTAIARAAGSPRLLALLQRTLDELERFFVLGARLRDINAATRDDHAAIIAALRDGDPGAARAAMIRHNEDTRRGLVQALAESDGLARMSAQ